jgi:long-chain acyl-CoA synthetase
LDELTAFLRTRIGKHEMVQAMELRAELPKTAVGKLSKMELVDQEKRKREIDPVVNEPGKTRT